MDKVVPVSPEDKSVPIVDPVQPDAVALEAARQLLLTNGYNVLDSTAMARRLESERRKYEPLQKTLEQVTAENEAAKARLAEIDNKGKSADEIWVARQAEWQRRDKENADKLAQLESARFETENKAKMNARDRKLADILDNAVDSELARTHCLNKMPGISADMQGNLMITDAAGIEHTGADAELLVKTWWANNGQFLRRAPSPGPSGGSATRPVERTETYAYGQGGDLTARLLKAERANAQAKRK
jgi:hypothetical protein